ncbi:MAG: oligosaccharide flippase family protein [Anaerolineae bacterium]|nr:oligosaccharide flippase family protein [Anaerolineae bacterium]MDW8172014.1 oligosaccharide flippase family protein [Anaerolineae bacterium]
MSLALWWQRLRRMASYVRSPSFSGHSAAERSKERYRRIGLAFLASLTARGIGMLTTLITTPLIVNYLGEERYGMWFVLSSLVAVLAFADFGLGNGLLNAVAEAYGRGDMRLARGYISSALVLLIGLALFFGGLLALIYPIIPWARLFNVQSAQAVAEAGPSAAVFLVVALLSIPLGIVQRVQMGLQESYIDSLWVGAGRLLALLSLLLVVSLEADLPWLVLALSGTPLLVTALNGWVLFAHRHKELWPRLTEFDASLVQRLLRSGTLFFVLQVVGVVSFSIDGFVITQIVGPQAVTQYAVPAQLFRLVVVFLAIFFNPLWPAYGEAIARGDWPWVSKTFRASIGLGLVVSLPICSGLALFAQPILHLWVGEVVQPDTLLLLGLAIWTTMNSLNGPIAVLLNGANVIGFQVVTALVLGATNLGLSVFLTHQIGIPGVVWGSIIAQWICVILPSLFYIRRMLRMRRP